MTENDRKDHHRQKRADHGPGGADHGLLVAYRDVAPGKDREQLAIGPDVAPVVTLGPARFEDEDLLASGKRRLTDAAGVHTGGKTRSRARRSRAANASRPKRARVR